MKKYIYICIYTRQDRRRSGGMGEKGGGWNKH